MPAHTPGPWIEGEASKDNWYVYAEKGTTIVAELERGDDGSPEHRRKGAADARLIAAAPALLEALEECVDSLEYVNRTMYQESGWAVRDERVNKARDAIAQAKGETV